MEKYEDALRLIEDTPENYHLNTPYAEQHERELFFGAIKIKKNYVSYHLMPVYMYPDLLDDLSPVLKKRMQGKSCFNFKKLSPEQLQALSILTQKSFDRLRKEGVV